MYGFCSAAARFADLSRNKIWPSSGSPGWREMANRNARAACKASRASRRDAIRRIDADDVCPGAAGATGDAAVARGSAAGKPKADCGAEAVALTR